jgi:hypothetical protein
MSGITAYLLTAVVLALAGAASLAVGALERRMAATEERLATLQYEDAAAALSEASELAQYGRWAPGRGERIARDLETYEASLQYWQKQYEGVLPRDADPVGAVEPGNLPLQLVVANAAYRAGQRRSEGREATIQMLDETIAGYATVLGGDEWDERAAYNYEYLVRVRDELARGRRKSVPPPPEDDSAMGSAGAPAQATEMQKFEIYVPLEGEERNEAAEAGKSGPKGRKG